MFIYALMYSCFDGPMYVCTCVDICIEFVHAFMYSVFGQIEFRHAFMYSIFVTDLYVCTFVCVCIEKERES